jgi:hypothetical protein
MDRPYVWPILWQWAVGNDFFGEAFQHFYNTEPEVTPNQTASALGSDEGYHEHAE